MDRSLAADAPSTVGWDGIIDAALAFSKHVNTIGPLTDTMDVGRVCKLDPDGTINARHGRFEKIARADCCALAERA